MYSWISIDAAQFSTMWVASSINPSTGWLNVVAMSHPTKTSFELAHDPEHVSSIAHELLASSGCSTVVTVVVYVTRE